MENRDWQCIKIVGSLFLAGLAIDAVRQAWGTQRWVANFFEAYVAGLCWGVLIIGIPGLALWLGMTVSSWTYQSWRGWVAGVGSWAGLSWLAHYLFSSIPGVGWRLNAMFGAPMY